MILLVPILVCLAVLACLILISNFLLKNREKKIRFRSRKRIIISFSVLFPILGVLYFLYLFGLGIDDHHDVKRGTFLWFATMDNRTITNFPLIDPIGSPKYNSIGGDSPNIGTGWEITYQSQSLNKELLISEIINFLEQEGYTIEPVSKTQYYWNGRHKKNDTNQLFSGYKNEESLDLTFNFNNNGATEITCSIVK